MKTGHLDLRPVARKPALYLQIGDNYNEDEIKVTSNTSSTIGFQSSHQTIWSSLRFRLREHDENKNGN